AFLPECGAPASSPLLQGPTVPRTLLVIPDLQCGGAARQLPLLASGLPADRFPCQVCVLGSAGPWAETLRRAGVEVDVFGWRRLLDPQPLLGLRQHVQSFAPDVIHAWRRPALGAAWLVRAGTRIRPVPSDVLSVRAGRP